MPLSPSLPHSIYFFLLSLSLTHSLPPPPLSSPRPTPLHRSRPQRSPERTWTSPKRGGRRGRRGRRRALLGGGGRGEGRAAFVDGALQVICYQSGLTSGRALQGGGPTQPPNDFIHSALHLPWPRPVAASRASFVSEGVRAQAGAPAPVGYCSSPLCSLMFAN